MNSVVNKTRLQKLNSEIKQNERRQRRENLVEDIDIGRFFELATTDGEIKQNERRQRRENMVEDIDIDISRFFELATSDEIYVNN